MKKVLVVSLILSLLLISLNYSPDLVSAASFPNGYPEKGDGIKVEGNEDGLAYKTQKITVTVTGTDDPNPKTVWTEGDRGQWVAVTQDGERVETVTAIGTDGTGRKFPRDATVKDRINMYNYVPASLRDSKDNPFKKEFVKELGIADIGYTDALSYSYTKGTKPQFTKGKLYATLLTTTGHTHLVSIYNDYETGHQGQLKYQAHYFTPLTVDFEGYVTETKELRVSSNSNMKIGETKNLKAEVRTQEYDMTGFTKWLDITRRTEQLQWSSDRSSVVTVGPDGKVTAVGKGTAKITAKWKSYPYYIHDFVTITVGDGDGGGGDKPDPPNPTGSCTAPVPGTKNPNQVMDPKASAVIKADNRGSEQFDVLLGIPTSDHLYANAFAYHYLFKSSFVQMSGRCTFEVPVEKTFIKKWDEPGTDDEGKPTKEEKVEEETVSDVVTVERSYSFWVIDNLEVYKIQEAKLQNTALPGGGVTLEPQNYTPPDYRFKQQGGIVKEPEAQSVVLPSQTVGKDIPDYSGEFKSAAEKAIGKVRVQNDSLTFQGKTIMSGQAVDENGSSPGIIPFPTMIGENTLYKNRLLIHSDKVNAKNLSSSGTIYYKLLPEQINGGTDQEFPIPGINPVTIHTPVVTYASVSDDWAHNQKTKPSPNRAALILERPFKVRLPTSGQHVSYPGYGNRDYAKYVRTKQVWFPFDVYSGDRSRFFPKRTWIDIPVNQLDTTFFLPVLVDEGNYSVLFRTIAVNAPVQLDTQPNANTDLKNHVSTDVVEVEVIGRLYDFRLTDIVDYNWEKVFRKQAGSHEPTGASYWVGEKGIDGERRGNRAPYMLPIRPGSHPLQGYRNVAVKTGYHFKFDLKTKGNMFGPKDSIRITPSFYYASKDGKTRFPVDLYYHSNDRYFIRIGSQEDQVGRYVILNERLRNVPTEHLSDTASYKYDREGQGTSLSRQAYIDQYIEKWTRRKTPVGGYGGMLLPEAVRTFIGPKSNLPGSVNAQRANASIQQWYGEYSLPAGVYIVKAGTDIAEYGRTHGGLHDKSPIFLRDGYLIVNFNIESIRDGRTAAPHLQYIQAPLMNQWRLEGFERTIRDSFGHTFALQDGDVLFYHTNLSSRDDFGAMVPH
ncbi:DUF5704 domain-containing protein [Paenibacillus dendritiformis]|uniref:DUF5704 domain-containing protein n=1 Tax=Paenibacillus dendritiformis TaxID=130049 RepID=UPI0031B9B77C